MTEPRSDLRHRMGRLHEAEIAKLMGGTAHAGSGNQWHSQTDGHTSEWSWDCKSTLAQSMSIPLATLDKLEDQAYPLKPMLPIRFYGNDRLTVYRDFVWVGLNDFLELYNGQ